MTAPSTFKPVADDADAKARNDLAFEATYQVGALAQALIRLVHGEDWEGRCEAVAGMAGRIAALSDIIFHVQRLAGEDDADPDMTVAVLRRAFDGTVT